MGSNIDKDIINYEGSVDDAVHTTNYNEQNWICSESVNRNLVKEFYTYMTEKDLSIPYAGYGPETSNIWEMLGLERVAWGEEKEITRKVEIEEVKDHRQRTMKQTSLSDFIPK
jgi:hypothetical protein